MVGFHIFNPLLYIYTKVAPQMLSFLYRKLGVPGILAMPWITLAVEKVTYDTFLAARGHDMKAEAARTGEAPHGGFPSGGASLPSWSLVAVANEQDRWIIDILGDKPCRAAHSTSDDAAER